MTDPVERANTVLGPHYFKTQIPPVDQHASSRTITNDLVAIGAPFSPKPKEFRKLPRRLKAVSGAATEDEIEECQAIRRPFNIQGYRAPYVQDVVCAFRLLKGAKAYLEIGTFDRGNLAYVSTLLADDAVLIGVDVQEDTRLDGLLRKALKPRQRYISITGNSLQPRTIEMVHQALGGRQLDGAFIDGDHTAYGAMSDYANYSVLVKSSGFVMFHDSLWEGDNRYKGVADALSEIDRLNPIYLVPGIGPCHRFMRSMFRDPQWGIVGICKGSAPSPLKRIRKKFNAWLRELHARR